MAAILHVVAAILNFVAAILRFCDGCTKSNKLLCHSQQVELGCDNNIRNPSEAFTNVI